jgi:hypothetical protein
VIAHRRRSTAAAAGVALCLMTAACGGRGPDPLVIGMKRIALNLAFAKDELAAPPVPPEHIITYIPAPPELIADGDFSKFKTPPKGTNKPPPPPPCAVAPPGTPAAEPVPIFARGVPKEGSYSWHNEGTIKITGTVFPITIPYPPKTKSEIRNLQVKPATPGGEALTPAGRVALGLSYVVTYDVVKKISPELIVTDSYRYDESNLVLTKRAIKTQQTTTEFVPQPTITFLNFGKGEGDTWSSAGIDTKQSVSMVVQGLISNREFVDLCGVVVDAFRIVSNETSVNLSNSSQSGTDAQQPNVYWFANQFGALVIQEEGHFTQVVQVDGAPVTLEFDYKSTLDSTAPGPLPPAAP